MKTIAIELLSVVYLLGGTWVVRVDSRRIKANKPGHLTEKELMACELTLQKSRKRGTQSWSGVWVLDGLSEDQVLLL